MSFRLWIFGAGNSERFHTVDIKAFIAGCPVVLPHFHIKEIAAQFNEGIAALLQSPADL
jgi:hypothetical protein